MTGVMLDHYRILDRIGAGGMGEVYRAVDRRSGRTVAIKVPLPRFRSDPEHRARFRREASMLSALKHPNICAVHETGRHINLDYLAMELLEGETLRQRMKGHPLPVSFLLKTAIQVARALAAAHASRVLHGDLKPENIFLTRQGIVKLLDFGLARSLPAGAAPQAGRQGSTTFASRCDTLSVEHLPGHHQSGTLFYMSPEQARGDAIDLRSDLFSFGVVLYEMAAGRRPFDGRTAADTVASILRDDPPPPSAASGRPHPGIDCIVRWCLMKAPARRCQSACEIVAWLERLPSGRAIRFAAPIHHRAFPFAPPPPVLPAGDTGSTG